MLSSLTVLLRGDQGLIEIPEQVIQGLQPNGNADHVRADPRGRLFVIRELLVRGAAMRV